MGKGWLDRGADVITHVGEVCHQDWLVYNPLRMRVFHRVALSDADAVADALTAAFPDAHRVADVGSGTGTFAAALQRRGLSVVACERSGVGRLWARRQGVRAIPFDLARQPPARLEQVDLAYCFEVAEHLPPNLGDRLVAFLCDLAPAIAFTAATVGQGGSGHVNEQPHSYWMTRFREHAYQLDADASAALAADLAQRLTLSHWLSANIMVFRRIDVAS